MPTTTTNFGWTVPADTDLVKDGAAAIRTALGGVDTSFLDLKGGTTGQVLAKASGTDLDYTWTTPATGSTFAGCRLYKNNTQALQDSTNTIITWDQESFDTDAFHDNSTNNSRITIPSGKAGKYLFVCILSLQSNTVGTRFIRLRKNGTNVANFGTRANNATGFPQNYVGIQSIETASVGDYFEIQAWQNSTEVQGLENGADQCLFSAAYLGA